MAFRVLITGGSISGLTLAIILEKYGIDYLILEKQPEVAPFLGTTVGINPNGARILDQLGVFSALDELGAKQDAILFYDWKGKVLGALEPIDERMKLLYGYGFCFLNRQDLLRVLYLSIKDKSRIRTAVEIVDILEYESRIEVLARDGSKYTGDILVGADGVRSQVRKEMWRIANEQVPGYIPAKDQEAIVSTYSCMTGISPCIPGLPDRQANRFVNYHRSYVVISQTGGELCWWLAFFKHKKPFSHPNIPRYTIDDHQDFLKDYGSDKIGESTFEEIYRTANHKVLVPIEEYTLEKWSLGRIVLLGDSCQKIHPIIGQGANQAIESAACLADMIRDIALGNIQNTDRSIRIALDKYYKIRQPKALSVMHAGRISQCIDSLDTLFYRYLALYRVGKTPIDKGFLPSFAKMMLSAVSLKDIPQPNHPGNVLYEDQIRIQPRKRSEYTTKTSVLFLLLLAAALFYVGTDSWRIETNTTHFYSSIQEISINSLWLIEFYRFEASTLLNPILFIAIAAYTNRWDVSLSLWCAFYIYLSGSRDFYYPTPRAINVGIASNIPYAASLVYTLPIYEAVFLQRHNQLSWSTAHFAFPVLVYILSKVIHEKENVKTRIKFIFTGDADIPHLSRYYKALLVVTAGVNLWMYIQYYSGHELSFSWDSSFTGFTGVIIAFAVFTVWDLNRVNISNESVIRAFVVALLGTVFFGPGTILAGLWNWREHVIEDARKDRLR